MLERKEPQPSDFYIPAHMSLQERRLWILKQGDTFAILDRQGNISSYDGSIQGIYHEDTRYLSSSHLLVNGNNPLLLGSTLRDDNGMLIVDLTTPDIYDGGELKLPKDAVHIVRSRFIWKGIHYERIKLHNFHLSTQTLTLDFLYDVDFTDIFEVRGEKRTARGIRHPTEMGTQSATFRYEGLDQIQRFTQLRFDPVPHTLLPNRAVYAFELKPGEQRTLFINMRFGTQDQMTETHFKDNGKQFLSAVRQYWHSSKAAQARGVTVETSNEVFDEVMVRAGADMDMLVTETKHGPYPYAGIPWFSTIFGRDGLLTALQVLWSDPEITRGVLRYLAANQATEVIPAADAEPGKILHEVRYGEMANTGEVPFRRYYGSIDSTPLFILLAGRYIERTGSMEELDHLWPHILAGLEWIDVYGDKDGDGFVEYSRRMLSGLANQGWKDSQDAVFHADGALAQGPIALCEVQGYVYAAKREAARLASLRGDKKLAAKLRHDASRLKQKFIHQFWDEKLGTFVLALDGEKRPCRVRSSNAAHLLFTGIAEPHQADRIFRQVMDRSFFSGFGIRTIATEAARYNPMSYHNGSIWPHDNAMIAMGMARYGHSRSCEKLFKAMFDAACYMEHRRLPELFCGFRRTPGQAPTNYPVACSPQAWACASPFAFLQACLGLTFNTEKETISLQRPVLPEFLDEVCLRNLRVGSTTMDIQLHRRERDVSISLLRKDGPGTVAITL
ncbi:MAG: amylo-alpha-1,6-glucosidase [Rickettsiales bacterium]